MCLQKKRNEKCVTACFLRGIYRYTNCLRMMTLLAVIPWCLAFSVADITDIRLVNGVGLFDGRVELLVNGTWGTICGTSFGPTEAVALCRTIFGSKFNSVSLEWYNTISINYGHGDGHICMNNLDCDSSATSINECSYNLDVSCTDHTRDVAVACKVSPLNITDTRLVNGTGPYDGRIELLVGDHWGTICNRDINMYDAQTICNTHKASLAAYFTTTTYGEGTGPVLLQDIRCSYARYHIRDCKLYFPYRPYCTHDNDLSVVCTPCGLPKIYNGEAFSFKNTELTVKCQPGFFPDFIKMRCLDNGTWAEDQRCTSFYAYPLDINKIRVHGSARNYHFGQVQLLVNGTWGTVCDTDFDREAAAVVCRMLGLQYNAFYRTSGGSGAIFVDKLNCNGSERHVNNCTYEISNYCTHYNDVAVVCTASITDIRLADGPQPSQGRVEIKSLNTWGTICDDDFGISKANLICRMIGYTSAQRFHDGAFYGAGKGPIFGRGLDCKENATDLNDCTYTVSHNCSHDEDISVVCTGFTITDIRLADGPQPSQGRVEIKSLNTWGTICGDDFGISEANFICRMVGYTRAHSFHTEAFYGEGKGPIFTDDLDCKENATDLNDCTYTVDHYCSHRDDISVVCTDCDDPTPVHGLSNSSVTTNGTVALIECEIGYTLIGESIITCQQNETWTDTPSCFTKEAVGGDPDKLIIILTVCIGSFAIAIIGLVIVKIFHKRNSTPRTVQESIAANGNEADTYHHVDNPTNIQQTDRGSETNMYESLREVDQQTSKTQSHYDMLTPTKKHYQELDHHTMETKETSFYEDLAL